MLKAKIPPDWTLLESADFFKGAATVSPGFEILGRLNCYCAFLSSCTDSEAQKLLQKKQEREKSGQLQNGSFEKSGAWQLKLHDGARAHFQRVKSGRTGQYALKLVKENALGFCQLVAEQPVFLTGGVHYTFRGYFKTQTAKLDSILLFRLTESSDDARFAYDAIDRAFGYSAQSILINCNLNSWIPRLISHCSERDKKVFANVLFCGGPGEVEIDDLSICPSNFCAKVPNNLIARKTFPYTSQQVDDILAKRPNAEAYWDFSHGNTRLMLNGRAAIPALYKSEVYHADYVYNRYMEFGDSEVPFAVRSVVLTPVRNDPGVVLGPGKYNFKLLNQVIEYALRQNPYVNLVVEFVMNEPYPGWGEAHPTELWRNKKGQFAWGTWGNREGFANSMSEVKLTGRRATWSKFPLASYSSESYVAAHCRTLQDLTHYLMNSKYGKAIVGFNISGGHDAQFQYFDRDYSCPAKKAFQRYLSRRYQTIENLNKVYNQNYTDFSQIDIPEFIRAEEARHPNSLGLIADYNGFMRAESFSLKNRFAREVRLAAGKRVFISAYGLPLRYHAETACKDKLGVEMFAVPSWYGSRRPGYPVGAKPDATFQHHRKLWLNELDLRAWNEPDSNEVHYEWLGCARNIEEWKSVHHKFAGIALAHRSPWWYYSMYRYFDQPEIMQDIKNTMQAARKVVNAPYNYFRPDVCVIRSELSDDTLQGCFNSSDNTCLHPWQLQQFEISGVPYDLHCLNDVLNDPKLQQYKMYVFLHTALLSHAQRTAIKSKLEQPGKTLVYLYNSGYLDDKQGKNTKFMNELTGWNINTRDLYGRLPAFFNASHHLVKGISPIVSGGEMVMNFMSLRGASPHTARYQIFHPQEKDERRIIARYADHTPAIVERESRGARIIYAAPPLSINAEFFNRLAVSAQAYVASRAGQSLAMNGNFLSLHGVTPGDWTIKFPPGVRSAVNLFTGEKLPATETSFKLSVDVGKSYWIQFNP